MVNTSLKRRRTEDQLRGKVPKKEKKKVKKQKFYHSSSEDEGGARDAPEDYEHKRPDSDDEPFEPTGANATLPRPEGEPRKQKKQPKSAPKAAATPAPEPAAPPKATPKHTADLPVKSVLKKTAPVKELEDGDIIDDSPGDDEEEDSEPEADEFDVEDSESDASDDTSVSETSTTAARKVRKRNDPEAFATSISKILNTKLTTTKRSEPILARSKDAQTANKEIADSKLTEKARRQVVVEKRAAQEKGRVKDVLGLDDSNISTAETVAQEKALRRTAQKGVIKLFNAVRAAQVKGEQAEKEAKSQNVVGLAKREEKVKEMSKQGFLDMITGGSKQEGSLDDHPAHLLAHLDLTSQSTCLRQPKCQIQHVVLVVVRLPYLVVVVGLCNVEEVVAVCDCEGVRVSAFVYECDCASACRVSRVADGKYVTAYSSPGRGGSRWPWRGVGVDENCRYCEIDIEAFSPLDSGFDHGEILLFAAPTAHGTAGLARLENLPRLDDAHVGLDGIPSAQRKTPTQVLREAMNQSSAAYGSRLSKPSLGSQARDILSDLDYDSYFPDTSPTVAGHAKRLLDQALWNYTSVLLAQPFEVAKTILQVHEASGQLPPLSRIITEEWGSKSRPDSFHSGKYVDITIAKQATPDTTEPVTLRNTHSRSPTCAPQTRLEAARLAAGGTNVAFIYNFLLKTTESWLRSAISAILNVPDPGLMTSASGIGGLDIIDSPSPLMSLGVAVTATAIAAALLAPLDLIRTRLIVTPISSSPRSIYPSLALLPSLSVSPKILPATLLHACIPTLISSSTPLLLRSTLSIDPILTPTTYSFGTFLSSVSELFVRLPLETVLRRGQVAVLQDHEEERISSSYRTLPTSRQRSPTDESDTSFKTIVEPGQYRGVLGTMWFITREEGITIVGPNAAKAASAKSMGFERPSRMRKGQGVHGLWRGWRVGVWGLVGIWGAAAMGGGGGEF
ncbi:Rrp15p-domain-containing protein [Setomelanomma holmii]|uniref:Rrp15p-domain-containing protein n=1 Tax=Setomelanomma holmii TaxID=210430 RepID=A0A9P4GWV6_9PLEO|nr:Rrp15p-domain-containing protein [Setomelanomma holmii]